jgi:DNA polymerase
MTAAEASRDTTGSSRSLGREFNVTRQRGRLVESSVAPYVNATMHPSSILRAPDNDCRRQQMQDLVRDRKAVAQIAPGEEAA